MRTIALLVFLLCAAPAVAQESQFQADLRREGEHLTEGCSGGLDAKKLVGCAVAVATEDPFHVAVGSVAPQNGMGFGLAFAEHYTPNEHWRLGWNADSVIATSGSWRAGAYMKIIHTPTTAVIVRQPGSSPPSATPTVTIREYPVVNLYAQTISLNTLTLQAGQGEFSEHQTIAGASVIYPLKMTGQWQALRPSVIAAVNGRVVDVRGTAVELDDQRTFAQFEEGVRIKPVLLDDRLRLNYLVDFQQFATGADAHASFHRWALDLKHEVPLYRSASSTGPKDANGPDECFQSLGSDRCPSVSYSRNLEGSIGFRFLTIQSGTAAGDAVPFYFQPTLGGSDINGQRLLAGYDDYRFRGPNLMALQESLEHSVWGPIGAYVLVEQGKVSQAGDGSGTAGFSRSYAVGLTLRAGGFPLVNLTFAWGSEGHHIIGTIDPTLLGGSARPSLY
jgi:hypothetical protein